MEYINTFFIKSSSGGSYPVKVEISDGRVRIKCSCTAAENFTFCKHIDAIITNKCKMLEDPKASEELKAFCDLLAQTDTPLEYEAMLGRVAKIDKEFKAIKKDFSARKKDAKRDFLKTIS